MTWQLAKLPGSIAHGAVAVARPVTSVIGRAAAYLPILPWYAWAGIGVGSVVLLGVASRAAAAAAPPELPTGGGGPQPSIHAGSVGPAVSLWQTIANAPVTGTFDQATVDATKAWQTAHGLAADGFVGPMTWKAAGYSSQAPAPLPVSPGGGGAPAPPAVPSGENPFGLSDSIEGREAQILSMIEAGKIDHEWVPLTYTKNGKTVTVQVSRRALALSDGANRLPVSLSFVSAQKAADMLGGAMLTTRMSDEIDKKAPTKLAPKDHLWQGPGTDESGSKTYRMLEQGALINADVGNAQGLVTNEGKDWVLTRRWWPPPEGTNDKPTLGEGLLGSPRNAANFGWYRSSASKSPGGVSVVQSVGLAHNKKHVDYSQLVRFVKLSPVTIDGTDYSLAEALSNPALSGALQDEGGTIPQPRHPDL